MARSVFYPAQDILTAIADIRSDTANLSYARFSQSPTVIRSALYSIGALGEVAKFLSEDFKAAAPDVPWRAIASLRDRIMHEYFRTNIRHICDVVTDELPSTRTGRSSRASVPSAETLGQCHARFRPSPKPRPYP